MNFQQFLSKRAVALAVLTLSISAAAFGQRTQPTPSLVIPTDRRPAAVARGNNLYCAGYIQQTPMSTGNRIVGGNDEADRYNYQQRDFVYLNMGGDKGVNVGDVFAVVRPRGQVHSRWTHKSDIGYYVQEVGALEVIRVKPDVSVARIRSSCDTFLLGDLVQRVEQRESPLIEKRATLDLFGDASGKARGRILMSRDGAEMISRDFIAYVDLGADDNVQVGDRLTVFRPLGKGNLFDYPQKEDGVATRDYGYRSDVYAGGDFSNQAARKSGDRAAGHTVMTEDAKRGRPRLRKVLGEAVVLNVKERTATVVITRTAQEIHTGDWVEIQ